MTHDELREKVARAIAAVEANGPATDWGLWLPEADAAIAAVREALRELNDDMQDAAFTVMAGVNPEKLICEDADECWAAMLAASPLKDPRA